MWGPLNHASHQSRPKGCASSNARRDYLAGAGGVSEGRLVGVIQREDIERTMRFQGDMGGLTSSAPDGLRTVAFIVVRDPMAAG
jgi:hypothetical protein